MEITNFSKIAKGKLFEGEDPMGIGDLGTKDVVYGDDWAKDKEDDLINRVKGGAKGLKMKDDNISNKLSLGAKSLGMSEIDMKNRMKPVNFNFKNNKMFRGEMKMGSSSYDKKINAILGKTGGKASTYDQKVNMVMGQQKAKYRDKGDMFSGLKQGVSMQSKANWLLTQQVRAGAQAKEKRAFSNTILMPEQVAMNRVNMQKKMKMFGDYDNDGVVNVLDCDPMDSRKQAFWHKWLGGEERELAPQELASVAGTQMGGARGLTREQLVERGTEITEDEKFSGYGIGEKLRRYGVAVGGGTRRFGVGARNVAMGLGLYLTPEQRMEREKHRTERYKERADVERQRLGVARVRAEAERARYGAQPSFGMSQQRVPYSGLGAFGGALRETSGALQQVPMARGFESKVGYAYPGLGIDQSIAKIREMSSLGGGQYPFSSKVGLLTDIKAGGIDLPESAVLPAPAVPVTPTAPVTQPSFQPVAAAPGVVETGQMKVVNGVQYVRTQDGRWRNMKTGDIVNYPRGSYKKKAASVVYVQASPPPAVAPTF